MGNLITRDVLPVVLITCVVSSLNLGLLSDQAKNTRTYNGQNELKNVILPNNEDLDEILKGNLPERKFNKK